MPIKLKISEVVKKGREVFPALFLWIFAAKLLYKAIDRHA
jgi:hypothetical protein